MIIKLNRILRNSDSALAPSGGQTGADQPKADPMSVLAAMMAQRDSAPDTESNESPTDSATESPEELAAPAQEGEPGQETLPPENEPTAESQEPTAEGDEPTNEESPEQTELTAALADLSPTERKAALELVKKLQPGEIPRIAKLLSDRHQLESTVESLQKQLDEAESARVESRASSVEGALPEALAKLKTVDDVQSRLSQVETELDAVQDFLDANPGDAETVYQIGGKEMTRKDLIAVRAGLRTQAKQLPVRGQQLVQAQQFQQVRQQSTAALLQEVPVLKDADHPLTKTVGQLLKLPDFAGKTNGLELAYIMALGNQAYLAEKAKRSGKPVSAPGRPVGKVPLGKPHVAANGAGAGKPDAARVKSALEAHGQNRSVNSFAQVLEATGRG